jgi:2-polyprenyl-3-methyl-5-hydroxy-6-metoxy-1,4-benzoquinol methylase
MDDTHDGIEPASLERIVPDEISVGETTGSDTLRLHLDRYQFVKQNLVPGTVLDIACGVGYGTALLSESSQVTRALGVDISDAAVAYALKRYANARVSFTCGNAMEFSPAERFANVVSLETIEHVDSPIALFDHLVTLTAPGGRLIASVPITPSVDANPHHKSNFTGKGFRRMADRHPLRYVTSLLQAQPFNPISIALRKEARAVNLRRNLPLFYYRNPSHFFSRVRSTCQYGFVNRYLTIAWERTR